MTLMHEIQHAVVNIIPATENIEEAEMEKIQLEQVHENAVHSTEVEYHLASENDISRPTVMQDVQTMEVPGNGTYTYNGIEKGVRGDSNQAQHSAQWPNLNTEHKSIGTYANCETQTMEINHSTNATQTDFVLLQQTGSQTEIINEDCTATQTDVRNCVEKES